MKDQRVNLFGDFIKYLRYDRQPKCQVKEIMELTGLTRVTLLEIEKKDRNHITPYINDSFIKGFNGEFIKFGKEWSKAKEKKDSSEADFSKLVKTTAEMARSYSDVVDKLIILQDKYDKLKKKYKKLKNSKT